jgi:hypothetical protein
MPGMRLAHLHPLRWLGQRDRGFTARRRAARKGAGAFTADWAAFLTAAPNGGIVRQA